MVLIMGQVAKAGDEGSGLDHWELRLGLGGQAWFMQTVNLASGGIWMQLPIKPENFGV